MKPFRGKIVAADMTERTITIKIDSLGGPSGAVMGEEVNIVSVPLMTTEQIMDAEDYRFDAMHGRSSKE